MVPFDFVLILSFPPLLTPLIPSSPSLFHPAVFLVFHLLSLFLFFPSFLFSSFVSEQGLTSELCPSPARTSQVTFTISTSPTGSLCGTIHVTNTIGTWWSKSVQSCQLLGPLRRRKKKRKRKTRRTETPPKVHWWVSGCLLPERPGLKSGGMLGTSRCLQLGGWRQQSEYGKFLIVYHLKFACLLVDFSFSFWNSGSCCHVYTFPFSPLGKCMLPNRIDERECSSENGFLQ